MRLIVFLPIGLLLLSCGSDESNEKRNIPADVVGVGTPVEEEKLEVYYKIPDDIPLALAEAYVDYQELLTEKQWQFYLMQTKRFCDGYMDYKLLKLRVRLWFPDVYYHDVGQWRMPKYNRSLDDRQQAYSVFMKHVRHKDPEHIFFGPLASDGQLSQVNKRVWELSLPWYEEKFKDRIYDCVEGYDIEAQKTD